MSDILIKVNSSINNQATIEQIIKEINDNMPKQKCLLGALTMTGEFTAISADYPLKKINAE